MLRVFVAGGTGYVGRRLVRALLELGHDVRVLTRPGSAARVDLPSILASVTAARHAGAAHVVYVSVAQPAPIMQAYVAVRAEGEAALAASGLTATVLRPWYVLGPGHWWPLALVPLYAMARLFPATRTGAQRLGLVRLDQMVSALVRAVERPPAPGTLALVDVPDIRAAAP